MYCPRIIQLLVIIFLDLVASEDIIVHTNLGSIRGVQIKSRKGADISAFYGIRYAESPTEEKRFAAPVPVKPWTGILDATNHGPICPQSNPDGVVSEDCLNLNVFTRNISGFQPVMVFIHGGGYFFGSGLVARPDYLLEEEIILVTLNYRLGALGFLSTGNADAPGNFGYKDQVTAIKWVHDNIKAFGGNPELVTLVGHSAGSMSTNLHLVSPMSRGLFQRAILMSGTVTSHKNFDIEESSQNLAKALSCPHEDTKSMIQCLRKVPYQKIIDICEEYTQQNNRLVWNYVIEHIYDKEPFIVKHPTISMLRGEFEKVPIMTGISKDEFSKLAHDLYSNPAIVHFFNEHFEVLAPSLFYYEKDTARSKNISKTFKKFYFNNEDLSEKTIVGLEKLFSDTIITHGVHRFVSLARQHTKVYYYLVNYVGRYSHFYNPDGSSHGAEHGDELQYLFVFNYIAPLLNTTDPENPIIEKITSWWVQFAKEGDPNDNENNWTNDIHWKPCNKDDVVVLNIDIESKLSDEPNQDRYAIWDELFPIEHMETCTKEGELDQDSCSSSLS